MTHKKKTDLVKQLYPSLPNWEIALYSSIWTFSICYALYNNFLLSRKHYSYFAEYELQPSTWLGNFGGGVYRRDTSDEEWNTFSEDMLNSLPWFFLNFFGSQLLKKYNSKRLISTFHLALSLIYFLKNFGGKMTASMLAQPLVYFVAFLTRSKVLVWAASLGTLYSLTASSGPFFNLMDELVPAVNEFSNHRYIAHVTWAWINARCLSFCMDKLEDGVIQKDDGEGIPVLEDLVDMVGYVLYIPTVISGPIVVYRKHYKGMRAEYKPWTSQRILWMATQLFRYAVWFVVGELFVHFSYHASLRYAFTFVIGQGMWTVAGVALASSAFFHLKYVVMYGIPRVFGVADGIENFPDHPACVFRIHLYRDMWRLFDAGLYDFIVLYIYVPIMKLWTGQAPFIAKFLASSVAFVYIYVWHGVQSVIMMWAGMNYISVSLESIGEAIGNSPKYQSLEKAYLSSSGIRRLRGMIIMPLFLFSMCGNFVFLIGQKLGFLCAKMAVTSWPLGTPILLFIMYSGTQFCIEWKNWEITQKMQKIL